MGRSPAFHACIPSSAASLWEPETNGKAGNRFIFIPFHLYGNGAAA